MTLTERGSGVSSANVFAYTTTLPMPVSLSPTLLSLNPPSIFNKKCKRIQRYNIPTPFLKVSGLGEKTHLAPK